MTVLIPDNKWTCLGLNSGPSACKSFALSLSYGTSSMNQGSFICSQIRTTFSIGPDNSSSFMSPYPQFLLDPNISVAHTFLRMISGNIKPVKPAFISFSLLFLIHIYSELQFTDFKQPKHRIGGQFMGERGKEGKELAPACVNARVCEHVCSLGKHTHVFLGALQ